MTAKWAASALILCWLSGPATADDLDLPKALFRERDWTACVIECRRVETAQPGCEAAAALRRAAEGAQVYEAQRPWWKRVGAWPIKGVVAFYRVVFAPVVGVRCVLVPSCSQYAQDAAVQYGWLGVPMTGDRLVREPSVILNAERPMTNAYGQILYADPVSGHIGTAQHWSEGTGR